MWHELAVAVVVAAAAVKVVMTVGTDTSSSVMLEEAPALMIVSRMEMAKDWDDMAE